MGEWGRRFFINYGLTIESLGEECIGLLHWQC